MGAVARSVNGQVCRDAVVVIPGIMGSELVEAKSGKVIWGADAGACWQMLARPDGLARLCVTRAERAGQTGRIVARRLITPPTYAPWLGGLEPYASLLAGVRQVAPGDEQVLAFAYDWRLSVEVNARLLAQVGAEHLQRWRRKVPEGRLVLIAHSMGGLITRALRLPGVAEGVQYPLDIRLTITVGTPFYGSVKAALILGSAEDGQSPRSRIRRRFQNAARTMPGVYDLLPRYRCVVRGDEITRLGADDLGALGADSYLASRALEFGERLAEARLGAHHAVVGVDQPTFESLAIDGSGIEGLRYGYRRGPTGKLVKQRLDGDGTVCRDAADLGMVIPLPQQHGALAKTPEAVAAVRDILVRGEHRGPLLGSGELGIDPPDAVESGVEWTMPVTGVTGPAAARCTLTDLARPWRVTSPELVKRDGAVHARFNVPEPGLYRISAEGGGCSPVTQIIAAVGRDLE